MSCGTDISTSDEHIIEEDLYGHCCKVCVKGRACGDSCIDAYYECHVGEGCACNWEEP